MELNIYTFFASSLYTMDYGTVAISSTSEESAWKHLLNYVRLTEKEADTHNSPINETTVRDYFKYFEAIPLSRLNDGFVVSTNLPSKERAASLDW